MTVAELIERLKEFDPKMEVGIHGSFDEDVEYVIRRITC